jgi:hypothetical protein
LVSVASVRNRLRKFETSQPQVIPHQRASAQRGAESDPVWCSGGHGYETLHERQTGTRLAFFLIGRTIELAPHRPDIIELLG